MFAENKHNIYKRTGMKHVYVSTGVCIVGLAMLLGTGFKSEPFNKVQEEHHEQRRQERSERIEKLVNDWLKDQRAGGSGKSYWNRDASPSRLYSVSKWETVKPPSGRSDVSDYVNVLVDSSNKIGQPIRKTWKIDILYVEELPRISNVTDLSE
jgi:hypothetical protein